MVEEKENRITELDSYMHNLHCKAFEFNKRVMTEQYIKLPFFADAFWMYIYMYMRRVFMLACKRYVYTPMRWPLHMYERSTAVNIVCHFGEMSPRNDSTYWISAKLKFRMRIVLLLWLSISIFAQQGLNSANSKRECELWKIDFSNSCRLGSRIKLTRTISRPQFRFPGLGLCFVGSSSRLLSDLLAARSIKIRNWVYVVHVRSEIVYSILVQWAKKNNRSIYIKPRNPRFVPQFM